MGNIIKMIRHNSSRLLSGLIMFALLLGMIIPAQSASAKETEGVETSKTVIYDEETGTYKLRLEGYVTGSTITTETQSTVPTDFVVSMDISHSMPPCINCGASDVDNKSTGESYGKHSCPIYAETINTSNIYYSATGTSGFEYIYCADCQGWFKEAHFTETIYGTHGSTSDVRYIPLADSSEKASTIEGVGDTQFYKDHVCTESCEEECQFAGTRIPVYTTDEDFNTDNSYYRDNNVSHSTATYVVKYCANCGLWKSGSHTLNESTGKCSGGTTRTPYEIPEYLDTKTVQFYTLCKSRMTAAREAVASFVSQVKEMSKGDDGIAGTPDDIPHRVALIGFGGNETGDAKVGVVDYQTINNLAKSKYVSTGIYSLYEDGQLNEGLGYYDVTESYNNFESYYRIKSDETLATKCYTNALRNVTNATEYSVLEEGISELNYNYGTYISHAAIMAEKIFESTYIQDSQDNISRNRVAVFFTDGQPDGDGEGVYDQADESIQPAYRIKNNENYEASVYSIGIFAGANASKIWHLKEDNASQDEYMHMLSSNYPTAYIFEGERKVRDGEKNRLVEITDVNSKLLISDSEGNYSVDTSKSGYYYTAQNADELRNVFETIAGESIEGGADFTKLNATAIMQDVLTSDWDISVTEGGELAEVIEAYTMTYLGNDHVTGDKIWERKEDDLFYPVTVLADGKIIQVTGFDYSANYVGIDKDNDEDIPRGKKLVLEIPIKPSANNIGGKKQPTNVANLSAIYGITENNELEAAEHFDSPAVDIPTSITIQKLITGYGADVNEEFKFEYIVEEGFNPPAESEDAPLYKSGDGKNDGSSGNYLQAVGYAHNSKEFTLKANETFTIDNLLVGSVLKIKEIDIPDGYVLKSIVPNIEEEVPEEDDEIVNPEEGEDDGTEPEEGNDDSANPEQEDGNEGGSGEDEPEIPKEDSITKGDDGYYHIKINEDFCGIQIDVTNELTVTDITVSKEVTGNMGDVTRKFDFTASLKKGTEELSFPAADSDNISYIIEDGKAKFSLKDNEEITLNNIPYGTTLIIEEAEAGYEVSSSIDGGNFVNGNTATVLEISKDHHITFKNHKEVAVDTGVDTDTPFRPIVLLGFAIMAIMFGGKIYLEKQRSLHRIRR